MRLQQRPDARDLLGVAAHDCVGIADRDAHDVDPRDRLRLAHVDATHLGFVEAVAERAYLDVARADAHANSLDARLLDQPSGCDPRPVSRHLRDRPVRVDDPDLDLVPRRAQDLDNAVGPRCAPAAGLSDLVDVPVRLPDGRSHPRPPPVADRHAR